MAVAICTEVKNYKLTVGRTYEIIADEGSRIVLANDNGKVVKYAKELFNIQEEGADTMNQDRPEPQPEPIPVPEPVNESRSATVEEAIASLTVTSSDSARVVFNVVTTINTLIPNETESITLNNFALYGSNISCGVREFAGLTATCRSIDNQVNDMFEDDFIELRKEILKQFFTTLKNITNNHSAFITTSTNSGSIASSYEDLLDAEASAFTAESARNPNSGNQIKVWVM